MRRIVTMMLVCAVLWPMARLHADDMAATGAGTIQQPKGAWQTPGAIDADTIGGRLSAALAAARDWLAARR
jgi:hypothetical protein